MASFRKNCIFIFKDLLDEIFYDLDGIVLGDFSSIPKFFIGESVFGKAVPKSKYSRFIDISIHFEETEAFFVESNIGDSYFHELCIDIYCMMPKHFDDRVLIKKDIMRHISYHIMSSCLSSKDSEKTIGSDHYFLEDIKIDAFAFSLFVQSFYFNDPIEYLSLKNISYFYEIGSSEYNQLRVDVTNSILNIFKNLYSGSH